MWRRNVLRRMVSCISKKRQYGVKMGPYSKTSIDTEFSLSSCNTGPYTILHMANVCLAICNWVVLLKTPYFLRTSHIEKKRKAPWLCYTVILASKYSYNKPTSALLGYQWSIGRALDCWSTGRSIDPTPEAWFVLKFIPLAQVGPGPV